VTSTVMAIANRSDEGTRSRYIAIDVVGHHLRYVGFHANRDRRSDRSGACDHRDSSF
jgi:hypothetical protein